MKIEKNENEPTASEVLEGFDFRLKTHHRDTFRVGWCGSNDSPPRISILPPTQKRIEAAQKEFASLLKAFEGDSMMLQDTIDDLRKDLEVEKRSREELVNWINKADEIYWAKHKGTERQFIHGNLMTEAWLEVEKEKKIKRCFEREQNRLGLDSA
tara:strand:+ start:770 stop:1234 length:465 start_codon:yes stop_codon:yes gene_type:complete